MRKTHTLLTFLIAIVGILSVNGQVQQEKLIYHYSVMDAMRNGVYQGDITVKTLREKGNFGLGTYNFLDGEMIVLDGIFYRIASSGQVTKAEPEREVPFASLVVFSADKEYEISGITTIEMLQKEILSRLPSANKPYALRIECSFESIVTGGATKLEEKDTTGIAELMKTRPLYQKKPVSGMMVGFYNPPSFAAVDLSPFHFHFISYDKTFGGHLVSGTLSSAKIKISIDEKPGYEIVLPQQNKNFDKPWPQQQVKSSY
ncbi:acetolactate decarboxylase [Flavobacterium circumlabens]|uniref:Alpha-acetolactate decarboxylase n=1 Tax=Flavobacterium circumlabens TaxID=2133765 RepID=A0A4Y7U7L6_9FLAO|nr:acetolactate decarboxylase [Flavobacterium circumlabens]TCN53033.1 acetolactate decarboxylase [Flavobacterium circumlabens]TEB42410.1 acetolactate decarboxylase [Flavobacterium circumlabens]